MPHLIAVDIDDTLYNMRSGCSDRVKKALQDVSRKNYLVIATGRSLHSVGVVLPELGLDHALTVCSNGALIVRHHPSHEQPTDLAIKHPSITGGDPAPSMPQAFIIQKHTFSPAEVVSFFQKTWPHAVMAAEEIGTGFRVSRRFPNRTVEGTQTEVGWEGLKEKSVTRLIVHSPQDTSAEFMALVRSLDVSGAEYAVGLNAWLDITAKGVSKASALESLRHMLGVPATKTVAIGDGRNDLSMLAWAFRGVAMGQAVDEVKAAANEVTDSCKEDGAALILEQYC